VEKIGRSKLVIAGLWTDFGVGASIRQARQLGFEVFMVVDACGDVSLRAHQIVTQHLFQEGAVPMGWLQLFLALHRDWAPPEAYEALLNIAKNHAMTYGLEIQYAQSGLDVEKQNWQIANQKKGGGENATRFRSDH
jgi:nicotinamidase-related amidase